MNIERKTLHTTTQALITGAGQWRRMRNALENGATLLKEDRCEFVDEETIRVYSDSGEVYLTSLRECVNEGTDELCPAFAIGVPCKHRAALYLLRQINQGDSDGANECSECGKRFHIERLLPINMAALRAGEIVPSGVCPLCGFFCYPRGRAASAA